MNVALAVIIAAAVAAIVTVPTHPQKSPRHHIYYCVDLETEQAMPCLHAKTAPIDV